MLKWDDDARRGIQWWVKQDYVRKKIRTSFKTESNPGIDFREHDLGTVRAFADYEAYAGVNFKESAVQQYTLDNHYPPNPSDSPGFKSYYCFVSIERRKLPGDDYKSIDIFFLDPDGIEVFCRTFQEMDLQQFVEGSGPL
ncbi:MAG: hypothetical protein EXS36_04025 [Pedosphaera sp.]|nr:hypothetical protein [Pedosphaera sp.]